MSKIILFLCLFLVLTLSAPGGWNDLDLSNLDSSVHEALQFAVEKCQKSIQYSSKWANFEKVHSVQAQVVAGLKYKFTLSFNLAILSQDIRQYEVIVWAQPAGYNGPSISYSLLSVSEIQKTNLDLHLSGGWSDLSATSAEIKPILEESVLAVQRLLKKNSLGFKSVESVQSQIVAGVNYKLVLKFEEGRFQIVIWKQLDGSLSVTNVKELQSIALFVGVGGWSPLDANNLDTDAKKAAGVAVEAVRALLGKYKGEFGNILRAETQVVAGINYRFHLQFKLTGGSEVHHEVVVWRKLDGSHVVTSVAVAN